MSLGAVFASFAGGYAGGRAYKQDRAERRLDEARQDRTLTTPERLNKAGAVTQSPPLGAIPDMAGAAPPAASPRSLIELIDRTEGAGDYDTLYSHSQRDGGRFAGTAVSKMTIGDLGRFSDPAGDYGNWVKSELAKSGKQARIATPMGRYQFVGTTMRDIARDMNLPDDTMFSPQVQDAMFRHHARSTLGRAKTTEAKRALIRGQWEGFKHVSDADLDAAITAFSSPAHPMGARGPAA